MERRKKIIISIITGSVIVSSAIGISVGVYFSKVKKPDSPINKLIFNTFFFSNKDESKQSWEIDLKNYKVDFISPSKNGSSRLIFNIDNPQGFYDDCIRPYVSSLAEYTIDNKTVKLIFYDKSPVYYLEDNGSVLMYAYGSAMGYCFLTPFFQDPNIMKSDYKPVSINYPSRGKYGQGNEELFFGEINSYVELQNYNDAKMIFEEYIDSNSFAINDDERSITSYAYDVVEYYYENDQRHSYRGFDKNVYAKYVFNDDDITFTFYDKYYEDTISNPSSK